MMNNRLFFLLLALAILVGVGLGLLIRACSPCGTLSVPEEHKSYVRAPVVFEIRLAASYAGLRFSSDVFSASTDSHG
jgi:hypothetical protein